MLTQENDTVQKWNAEEVELEKEHLEDDNEQQDKSLVHMYRSQAAPLPLQE